VTNIRFTGSKLRLQ